VSVKTVVPPLMSDAIRALSNTTVTPAKMLLRTAGLIKLNQEKPSGNPPRCARSVFRKKFKGYIVIQGGRNDIYMPDSQYD
jgi:hypothetical protein